MKQIMHVAGARPNFMKVAPVLEALGRCSAVRQALVHTGQHYDARMSDIFFRQLQLPRPDFNLEVGSGTHAAQTARIMMRFEEVVGRERPDWIVVYGDVNSTLAAGLVAAKLGIRLAHVEAGLRSFDRAMPEEINRLLVDQISDALFTSSAEAETNLVREGVDPRKIHFVGNVMIDTLLRLLPRIEQSTILSRLGLSSGGFALVTLHRPSNVDQPQRLQRILKSLAGISQRVPIIFPAHPRAQERINGASRRLAAPRLRLIEPLGYLEFVALQRASALVITDSGGVQEETTVLGVPCLTLRSNTERPVTVEHGTNTLVGDDPSRLVEHVERILNGRDESCDGHHRGRRTPACDQVLFRLQSNGRPSTGVPPLWDGKAGERIAGVLAAESSARILESSHA